MRRPAAMAKNATEVARLRLLHRMRSDLACKQQLCKELLS
jgi:hypothetical protein